MDITENDYEEFCKNIRKNNRRKTIFERWTRDGEGQKK